MVPKTLLLSLQEMDNWRCDAINLTSPHSPMLLIHLTNSLSLPSDEIGQWREPRQNQETRYLPLL